VRISTVNNEMQLSSRINYKPIGLDVPATYFGVAPAIISALDQVNFW
jgi:hypothetical protein